MTNENGEVQLIQITPDGQAQYVQMVGGDGTASDASQFVTSADTSLALVSASDSPGVTSTASGMVVVQNEGEPKNSTAGTDQQGQIIAELQVSRALMQFAFILIYAAQVKVITEQNIHTVFGSLHIHVQV